MTGMTDLKAGDVKAGDTIPGWTIDAVSPDAMRVTSAICRDPNPIHWDRAAAQAAGFGPLVVNQGPLNLAYVANMLIAWAGPAALRRLSARFVATVQEGQHVSAGGVVTAVQVDADGTHLAHCEVWLARGDGVRAVAGTAVVALLP